MRLAIHFAVTAACLLSYPALASGPEEPVSHKPAIEKPVVQKDVSASDVAATPVSDLNLRRVEIPPQLVAARERPYDLTGMSRCAEIAASVGALDAALGEDVDVPQAAGRWPKAGGVAQAVVASFIPLRDVIREVSGANGHERELQAAINAGVARRSFLKGIGQARGCHYPARSATAAMLSERAAGTGASTKPAGQQIAAAPGSEPVASGRAPRSHSIFARLHRSKSGGAQDGSHAVVQKVE